MQKYLSNTYSVLGTGIAGSFGALEAGRPVSEYQNSVLPLGG